MVAELWGLKMECAFCPKFSLPHSGETMSDAKIFPMFKKWYGHMPSMSRLGLDRLLRSERVQYVFLFVRHAF